MMSSRLKKPVVVFSLFITAAGLYMLSQELSTKENLRFQSTRNATQLFHANEQLIMFITSAPFQTSRRNAIRQTWLSLLVNNSVALGRSNIRAMKNPSNSSSNFVIHYWFVCGHDTKREVEATVANESTLHGDILRLDYSETYSLLIFKTLSSLWLASTMDVQFIVKVDDDIYLHVPTMIWWLKTSSLPEKLYAGSVQEGKRLMVIRNPRHKWYVSEQFLNESRFPPYCNGPFYILSKSALLGLLNATSSEGLAPFPIEDAYIGILAKRAGITPLQLRRKHVFFGGPHKALYWGDEKLKEFFAFGHSLSIEKLYKFQERFTKLT